MAIQEQKPKKEPEVGVTPALTDITDIDEYEPTSGDLTFAGLAGTDDHHQAVPLSYKKPTPEWVTELAGLINGNGTRPNLTVVQKEADAKRYAQLMDEIAQLEKGGRKFTKKVESRPDIEDLPFEPSDEIE